MTYPVDSFHAAASVLVGHGHIKQRLMKAFEDHLDAVDEDEVPRKRRNAFVEIQKAMHRVAPLNGEGSVCASVRKMSPIEAGDCAITILAIYREMLKDSDDNSVELPVDHENRTAVPPFLLKSV
ncbi:MAG: hypothetical protein ACR2QS_15250 [Woeseiaceae bacterium]